MRCCTTTDIITFNNPKAGKIIISLLQHDISDGKRPRVELGVGWRLTGNFIILECAGSEGYGPVDATLAGCKKEVYKSAGKFLANGNDDELTKKSNNLHSF